DLSDALGVRATVLPMSDQSVRTRIDGGGRWWDFQEWMIRGGQAAGAVDAIEFAGVDDAAPPPEALRAIADAELIVIGPSNPFISIDPILAVPGMRAALASSPAPVVAVSPI